MASKAPPPGVFARIDAAAAAPPPTTKRPVRSGLRALVPSSVNAEGESDPFLKSYKTKWLSRLDFKSGLSVESLLMLAFMVLAHGRESEAEVIAVLLIRHVDVRTISPAGRAAVAAALRLVAWLKARRGKDVTPLLVRAQQLSEGAPAKDRDWLSNDAPAEVNEAVARRRLMELLPIYEGVVRWLSDSGGRTKAEAVFASALDATRGLMR